MPRVRFTLPQSLPMLDKGVYRAYQKVVWNRLREMEGWDWYRNRLVIEINPDQNSEFKVEVVNALDQLGVPAEAVIFKE